ncbi:ArsR/SmtB family transcription factor [Cellulomonas sp. 179-A 4D5 NHS]|uniref:ArsR/SmtB family transcription factor n=1 Tax=Cellulomonas sp. 179-A 4D5 NHS TaxID=3142378 RepID=UPI0039A104E7
MPRLTTPPDMPGEVAAAIEVIGNRVRARVLRELALHGPQTAVDLAAAIGQRREVVYQQLVVLEDAGLVSADEPPGRRLGRTVHWTVRDDAVQNLVARIGAYLAGK